MRKAILVLLLLLAGAMAADEINTCEQAAQLADANNKLLRNIIDEGFLTEDGIREVMSGMNNKTTQVVRDTGTMCQSAAGYIDTEFQWLKIALVAGGAAFILAVFVVFDRKARKAYGIVRPTADRNVLMINGVKYRRED